MLMNRRVILGFLFGIAFASLGGCMPAWPQREGFVRTGGVYVFHAPGIMGPIPHDHYFATGLMLAGVQDVQPVDWTGPMPLLNLSDDQRHEREALALAQRIVLFKAMHPEARVVLTGHSGGCRIVIGAVERLHPGQPLVEQIWLLSPALSPKYDLRPSLERVPRIVVVTSRHDWMILGMGTRLLGTSDGQRSDSAGRVGFECRHPRLEQWTYQPEWLALGYNGDHIQILNQRFAMEAIGPAMVNWWPDATDPLVAASLRPIDDSALRIPTAGFGWVALSSDALCPAGADGAEGDRTDVAKDLELEPPNLDPREVTKAADEE